MYKKLFFIQQLLFIWATSDNANPNANAKGFAYANPNANAKGFAYANHNAKAKSIKKN